jgi:hypothetical protein
MRAVCAGLCERGLLRITQRGVAVGCAGYKGPVRIVLTAEGRGLAAATEHHDTSQQDNVSGEEPTTPPD